MSTILTLVASDSEHPLTDGHMKNIINIIGSYNARPTCQPIWRKKHVVVELGITQSGGHSMMRQLWDFLEKDKIDVFITPIEGRRKKILLADMDSTIVKGETLDELAGHAGVKEQVAQITARAMNGELDFRAALDERVSLLKGLPVKALQETLHQTEINPGADLLVRTLRKYKVHCVLVSGGFTFFTSAIAKKLLFMNHHGNVLETKNDTLTGRVSPPVLGKDAKVELLHRYRNLYHLKPDDCMAIGDGANDLPMLKLAGFGVGYRAKDIVMQNIENQVIHGDFTGVLYAQGYSDEDIPKG